MKINWKKALGYGLLFYLIVYVVATAFVAYKINTQTDPFAWAAMMAVSLITGYVLSLRLDIKNYTEGLMYGLVWVVLTLVLDVILTLPFTGIGFFQSWQTLIGFVVTLLIPAGSYFLHGLLKSSK
jgi:peptidoglycan/LPS O-acetylase OafA/YrhL